MHTHSHHNTHTYAPTHTHTTPHTHKHITCTHTHTHTNTSHAHTQTHHMHTGPSTHYVADAGVSIQFKQCPFWPMTINIHNHAVWFLFPAVSLPPPTQHPI